MSTRVDVSSYEAPTVQFGCACGGQFRLGLDAMITGKSVGCTGCDGRLRVDLGTSQESLSRLQQALARLAEVRREAA